MDLIDELNDTIDLNNEFDDAMRDDDNDSFKNFKCALETNFNTEIDNNIITPTSILYNNEHEQQLMNISTSSSRTKNTWCIHQQTCNGDIQQHQQLLQTATAAGVQQKNVLENNSLNVNETVPNNTDLNRTPSPSASPLPTKRPSTLVIRKFYDNDEENSRCSSHISNRDECVIVTKRDSYISRRRPTLILGDLCIIPTENPALNDRRLSKLSSLDISSSTTATGDHQHDQNTYLNTTLGLIKKMSALVLDTKEAVVSISDLPLTFQVKYLGHYPAKGLWGIKHTRGPVDTMVKAAKNLPSNQVLPFIKVTISANGITLMQQNSKGIKTENFFSIETISYGVQDLVYTRVFSMIVVYEDLKDHHPFECHAFVCESRNSARKLTYALAAAFQDYSKRVQEQAKSDPNSPIKKKFAIDLRSPEELQEDMEAETEA